MHLTGGRPSLLFRLMNIHAMDACSVLRTGRLAVRFWLFRRQGRKFVSRTTKSTHEILLETTKTGNFVHFRNDAFAEDDLGAGPRRSSGCYHVDPRSSHDWLPLPHKCPRYCFPTAAPRSTQRHGIVVTADAAACGLHDTRVIPATGSDPAELPWLRQRCDAAVPSIQPHSMWGS